MTDIHALPPSPIHSPKLTPASPSSPPPSQPKEYLPSILAFLRRTHRYSAYTFSAFSVIHALNTGIAPLLSLHTLKFADDNLLAARALYHAPYVERIILGSLGVHIISGLAARIIRVVREYTWYRNRAKLPTLSWNAVTGYIIVPLVMGHVYVNRYLAYTLDIDVTSSIVGHLITRFKALGWSFYLPFVGISALHISNGIGQLLGWRKKRRYTINSIVSGLWIAGLIKIVYHGMTPGFTGQQYDKIINIAGQNLRIASGS